MIGLINTSFGNINALSNIYFDAGVSTKIVNNKNDCKDVTKFILPGIGKFDSLMDKLFELNMIETLNELVIKKEIPILGICIGMHVFYESSEEGINKGLGWIKGKIEKLNFSNMRLPHMGWNKVFIIKQTLLINNIQDGNYFYFLHSYGNAFREKETFNQTYTNYGKKFISSIQQKNIYGVQFHPEKSHSNGIQLLKNFSQINA